VKNKLLSLLQERNLIIKLFFILLATFIFYNIPKQYFGYGFPICVFKNIFNIECIGCGTTRAFWSILHLQFREALEYNKLSIITFPLLTYSIISWVFKKK